MSSEKTKNSNKRARHWTFIVYPESAPQGWIDKLSDEGLLGCISPLHDKDINPDGTKKKEHYHVLLTFSGMKSFNQIKQITQSINSPIPQIVHGVKGLIRYFTHEDNPEKVHYNPYDIKPFGGFDLDLYTKPTETERLVLIGEMVDFIIANEVYEYSEFVKYCRYSKPEWFRSLVNNSTYFISNYIKSLRMSATSSAPVGARFEVSDNGLIINSVTGEVFDREGKQAEGEDCSVSNTEKCILHNKSVDIHLSNNNKSVDTLANDRSDDNE